MLYVLYYIQAMFMLYVLYYIQVMFRLYVLHFTHLERSLVQLGIRVLFVERQTLRY